jgi:hypothetical protein
MRRRTAGRFSDLSFPRSFEMKRFTTSLVVVLALGLTSVVLLAQEKGKTMAPLMGKESMAAKKKMMEPKMMESAKAEMMSEKSKMPAMVAGEMVQEEMAADAETKAMVKANIMAPKAGEKNMMSDESVKMAHGKMAEEPTAMQALFQQLVARHIAAKKVAMVKKAEPAMATMAGKGMKNMAGDKEMMMSTSKEMATSEETAMMMAREELIQSLLLDAEVMAMVEKAAAMHDDPKMAPMIADDKIKREGEKMAKDKMAAKGIMKGAMARQMVEEKQKMMKKTEPKGGK